MAAAVINGVMVTGTVEEINQLITMANTKYVMTGGTMPPAPTGASDE